ncbi:MAG: YbbR-like domain-containing protein [Myxococcota bacterium]
MSTTGPRRRPWSRVLFENLWLKLIALVFSLAFYAFIHSQQDVQRTISVKLVVQSPPPEMGQRLMTDIPPSVDVVSVGPLPQLEGLGDDLSITLDLSAAQDDTLTFVPEMVSGLPPRVRLDRFSPSRLDIRFEPLVSRRIPVQVARTGEPAAGYELKAGIAVEPRTVTATGIESVVTTIQFARAEAFDVSGLGEGQTTRRLRLDAPPEGADFEPKTVAATADVQLKLKRRVFENVKVAVVGLPRARTRPGGVDIAVVGPPERIDELKASALVPRVEPANEDVDTGQPGSKNMTVLLDLDDGISANVNPPRVLVTW